MRVEFHYENAKKSLDNVLPIQRLWESFLLLYFIKTIICNFDKDGDYLKKHLIYFSVVVTT